MSKGGTSDNDLPSGFPQRRLFQKSHLVSH